MATFRTALILALLIPIFALAHEPIRGPVYESIGSGSGGAGGAYQVVPSVSDILGINIDPAPQYNIIDPLGFNIQIMAACELNFGPCKVGETSAVENDRHPVSPSVHGPWPTQPSYTGGDVFHSGIGPGSYDTIIQAPGGVAWGNHHLIGPISGSPGSSGHLTVLGGTHGYHSGDCDYDVIIGGTANWIECPVDTLSTGSANAILSGRENRLRHTAADGVTSAAQIGSNIIVGGRENEMLGRISNSFILGGAENIITDGTSTSNITGHVVLGGKLNTIKDSAVFAGLAPSFSQVSGRTASVAISGMRCYSSGNYNNGESVSGQMQDCKVQFRGLVTAGGGTSTGKMTTTGNRAWWIDEASIIRWRLRGQCVVPSELPVAGTVASFMSWEVGGTLETHGTASNLLVGGMYADGSDVSVVEIVATHQSQFSMPGLVLHIAALQLTGPPGAVQFHPYLEDPSNNDPSCVFDVEFVEAR